MGNSWNAQTGVRGRVYNVPRQSGASVRRIVNQVPKQDLRHDSIAIGDWQVNIPNTACVRNEHPTHRVSSYGHKRPFVAVTLRRKARK